MNAYDFDHTIFQGDASVRFYLHCLRRFARVRWHALGLIGPGIAFVLGRLEKTLWKQKFFSFVAHVPEIGLEGALFWDRNEGRIKDFYRAQRRADDLIISASPEFLLWPMMRRLGLVNLIASRVDMHTGAFDGKNCHGAEKVRRLQEAMPETEVEDFYSDSLSDLPMAKVAVRAFLVKGDKIREWEGLRDGSGIS